MVLAIGEAADVIKILRIEPFHWSFIGEGAKRFSASNSSGKRAIRARRPARKRKRRTASSETALLAQDEIVAAEEDTRTEFLAEFVHDVGEVVEGGVAARKNIERKAGIEAEFIHIGEPERDEAEADAAFPGFAEEDGEFGIEVGFEIGGFGKAFGGLVFVHVVIADFDGESTDAFAVGADFGHKFVGHAAEGGFEKGLIGGIGSEGFLFAVGFGGGAGGNDRALVNTAGEIAELGSHIADEEAEEIGRGLGDLADEREARGI